MNTTPNTRNFSLTENNEYKARLHIALKAAKICVFEVDIVNQLYTFFENAEDIFGVSGEQILKEVQPFSELTPQAYQKAVSDYFSHPGDHAVIDKAFQSILSGQPTTYEARMRAGGSDYIWCKLDVTPVMVNDIPARMIGVITDISTAKANTDRLKEEAKLDHFTGLYNKNSAITLIQESLQVHSGQTHALVLTDIDNFKDFNDTYGHAVGDIVIKSVAEILQKCFRAKDIVGRFGGDEFILFVKDIPNMEWFSEKLQQMLSCKAGIYDCTNSIGIALFPQDGSDFHTLFKKADAALYHSKLVKAAYSFHSDMEKE